MTLLPKLILLPVQALALLLVKNPVKHCGNWAMARWLGNGKIEFGPLDHSAARYTASSNYGPVERFNKREAGFQKPNERKRNAKNY